MEEEIKLIITFGFAIYLGLYIGMQERRSSADPKQERIKDWKRNKKKWAKHKFDV